MVLLGSEGFVVLTCLSFTLVGVDSISGNLPPPEDLSLSWHPSSLIVSVNWREPAGLDAKCKVNYTLAIYELKCPPRQNASYKLRTEKLSHEYKISKECDICVGITTNPMVCEEKKASEEIYKALSPPLALVTNFSCAYYANGKMNCTWSIVKYTPDLQLFYRFSEENTQKHCKSYLTTGILKTGCHLDDEDLTTHVKVYFVISGSVENHLTSNNFMIDKHVSAVKLPKPKVYITQEGERLHFQASTPNFLPPQCLKYKYIYNKCNEKNEVFIENSSTHVEYDSACKYTVRGQVVYTNYCAPQNIESEMSEPEFYGEDCDPNLAFKVAMIITPLIVCCCLIAAIVLFRRNKDIILPKIPEPSLFFKDMLNSTSDGLSKSLGGGKLYVPVKEVVASGVSLEPKSSLLHPNHDTCI
ncbi:hypothetical protein AMELA_G00065320 [Ameiurus melas]|uniref:Type I cytokine receptor cytokine-binding domain-containing protein n=1 Tax=Ameiurus melas TaxID=219545 RepID=A0A7J6B2Z1_AMEME|nr:hypothetical protein AMELA_G00065320 [Ameiurus melas]